MGGLKTKSTSSLAFYPRPLLISLRCSIFFSSRSTWEPFHSLVSVIHKHRRKRLPGNQKCPDLTLDDVEADTNHTR